MIQMSQSIKQSPDCNLCPYDAIYCHITEKSKNIHYNKNHLLPIIKGVLRLPKEFDDSILEELELRGLIKRVNHQKYYICSGTKACENAKKKVRKRRSSFPW
jgi:hypothetical protein